MPLEQTLKERIEKAIQSAAIDHRLQYELARLLHKDEESALEGSIAYAARGKPARIPAGFNHIAGDIYTARTTYLQFLSALESNDFYSFQLSQNLRQP